MMLKRLLNNGLVLACCLLAGGALLAQPANDLCTSAAPIADGDVLSGTTINATADGSLGTCGTDLTTAGGVWYTFVGNDDLATASTCPGATYDTKLGVFSGSCGALTCVAGNDDDCGLQSTVEFFAASGVTYYIYVTGFGTGTGDFNLSLDLVVPPPIPDNDLCGDAIAVTPGVPDFGTTEGSFVDAAAGFCGTTLTTAGGVWYTVIGDGMDITATTCNPGTNYDTKIGIFSGSCDALVCVDGNDDGSPSGDNPDPACVVDETGSSFNRASTITWTSEVDVVYYILVSGFGTNEGDFELLVTGGQAPPPPPDLGSFEINVSAITNINRTLDVNCKANLTARQVLAGDFDADGDGEEPGDDAFVLVVQDEDPSNGATIDGCGTWMWTIESAVNPADGELVITGFTTAWGFVNAEDKTSPELDNELSAPAPLYCDALDGIDISQLPSSISRCWIQSGQDGTTIDGSMSPVLRARLLAGGGIPNFTDGCSDVEICVNDVVVATGACNDVVLTRTFTARDGLDCEAPPEGANPPAVYSYEIIFTRPSLEQVEGVPEDAIFNCDDQLTLLPPNQFGDENPAPNANDFPFFFGGNGQPIYLGANFCNIGATFTDGPRIVTCPQTYKFVRTFTVIDWCNTDQILSFPQLVKVGDFEAPDIDAPSQDLDFDGEPDEGPLFFSTSNPDCSANFIIPAGDAEDNCDPNPGVVAFILPGGDEDVAALGPFSVGAAALGIPVGDHVLRYIATDACDNSDTLDVDITIGDRTAPVAICEDGLDISIGGANSAILTPDDIDRASYDECTDIFLEIARVSENDILLTPWLQELELTCDDIGIVRVALRVTDDGNGDGIFQPGIDNSNVCWLNVLVEDKVGPICIAPGVVTTTCDDDDINTLPQDLTAAFAADPTGVGAQLDAIFGEGNGIDNCPDPTVSQSVLDLRNSCGVGTIIRTFTVTDGAGFTSAPGCQQTITVLGVHDYTIQFPADAGSEECIEPDYNGVTYDERACDLLTVTTHIDTFEASADECYKLRITYEVLNWCEYGTEEDPYIVPRDADDDDFLEESTWLHVLPRDESTTLDDIAWLDADGNRFNGFLFPLDDDDPNGAVPGSSSEPYGTDESRGAFLYRQFIKVYDDVAPVITTVDPDGPFNDDDGDCAAPVELGFSVADECTGVDAYDAEVELDPFFEDVDGDGVLTLADFVPTGAAALQPIVTDNGDGTFTVEFGVDLPLGTHAIRITATDGCGNADIALIIFEVADNKAPTPICINGLTATLMPDGNGGGMAAIWASEYIASEATDCNGPVEYAIYRASTAAADGFEPMVGDTGLELTCDDLGMLAIRVYAIDAGGQSDYCETTLFVQAFQENVCSGGDGGSILGTITTPAESAVANVEVSITDEGQMNNMIVTGNDGTFAFTDLTVGDDYTVQPELDADVDVANAVTTYDILLINRHILAIQELATPYEHVAADVTMDGDINVLDVVHVRMVIMGQTPTFPVAPSWRFANADYDFGTNAAAWAGANFDEVYNVNNLPGDMLGADFYGIQMGDVSGSAAGNNLGDDDDARSTVGLETADLELAAGNTYEVVFTAKNLYGFQGTLELAAGLELVGVDYGQVAARNLNLDAAAEGLIAVSYDEVEGITEDALFTLEVRATSDALLSDLLSMTDRVTVAEAYPTTGGVANLGINFGAGFASAEFSLGQNIPNPVADQTQINYNLVEASQVTFELRDVQGRMVLTRQLEGAAGMNVINLNSADLRGATGVLSYTLTAGDHTATRKMIVVR